MPDNLIVTVQDTSIFTAVSNLNNPAYVQNLASVGDIDITTNGQVNGSVLVYNTSTSKWTATRLLESQDISGGQY